MADYSSFIFNALNGVGDSVLDNRKRREMLAQQQLENEFAQRKYSDALMQDQRDYGFRQSEAERSQRNWEKSYGLDAERLGLERQRLNREPKVTPYTDIGKAYQDFRNGLLSEDQFRALSENPAAPDPASFSNITAVRKELENQPGTTRYRTSVPIVSSMQKSINDNTAMSDLDFVYGMAKVFDPTSVVRESEMGLVLEGQSIPASIMGMFAKAAKGEASLGPQARADLVRAAMTRVGEYRKQAEQEMQSYSDIARRNRINPDDIARPLEAMPEFDASAPPRQPTQKYKEGATATNPQTGQTMIYRGGQWLMIQPNGAGATAISPPQ